MEEHALITLFGATGDLAWRKLYPSLYRLYQNGTLQQHFAIIGAARTEMTTEQYREIVYESIKDLIKNHEDATVFCSHFYYVTLDATNSNDYHLLKQLTDQLDESYHLEGNRLFYLAMAPKFFATVTQHLKSEHITSNRGYNRLIIEKPFGNDYQSAYELNSAISEVFNEDQIFRIDHYLGKEMVQNILAIRFGNQIFESLWSNQYIDNIQITFAESIGVEDRGGYYEQSGALKDMVQNHVLQVLALLAMEPPTTLNEYDIRLEKIKALNAVHLYSPEEACKNFIRGQYMTNTIDGTTYKSYQQEAKVNPYSTTETFVAGKLLVNNLRWKGVPFYIRSGKRMTEKGTRIDIVFKSLPINLFGNDKPLEQNILTIYIQPTEGFSIVTNGKKIGSGYDLQPIKWEFKHDAKTTGNSPEAYEKLIADCLNGDSTNFTHWEEVAQSWHIVDAVSKGWQTLDGFEARHLPMYQVGSMGPVEADHLLEKDGCYWIWNPQHSERLN